MTSGSEAAGDGDFEFAEEDVIFQSSLYVVKGDQEQSRYVVLLPDRLEYYSDPDAFEARERPRVRVNLVEITRLEISTETLTLNMNGKGMRLKVDGTTDTVEWGEALEGALNDVAATSGEEAAEVIWDETLQVNDPIDTGFSEAIEDPPEEEEKQKKKKDKKEKKKKKDKGGDDDEAEELLALEPPVDAEEPAEEVLALEAPEED